METENLGMRMFGIGRAIQAFDGSDSDMEPNFKYSFCWYQLVTLAQYSEEQQ